MKKFRCLFSLAVILLFACLPQITACANETSSQTVLYIQDEASLLLPYEISELNALYIGLSEKYEVDIFAISIDKNHRNRDDIIEDFYDANLNRIRKDAIILLINSNESDRGVSIQGYGSCQYSVDNKAIASIIDHILPLLKSGDYAGALTRYGKDVESYLKEAKNDLVTVNGRVISKGRFLRATVRNLVIALIAALIVVFIMVYQRGGRMTCGQGNYIDASHSRVLGSYDRYTHTTTSKRPKPKPQDKSSGGSGTSSGGHSHSGGGSSF